MLESIDERIVAHLLEADNIFHYLEMAKEKDPARFNNISRVGYL